MAKSLFPEFSRTDMVELARPTRLDMAIGRIFPRWAAARIRHRREFSYEASRSDRFRNIATKLQGPEDYTAFPERLQLIRQVRDLEQNFGLFQSIIDKLTIYAFGRIKYRPQTGDKAANDAYADYFKARSETLDLSGRFSFEQLIQIAFKSQLRDGDFAYKWQHGADGLLKLCGIEGDRIGGVYMVSAGEDYFQGINIDPCTGQPVSYKVWRRTKANSYIDPVIIPASDMMLCFDPRRVNQYRGISPFAPVICEARDLKEVMEYCRIGTKFENMHAAIGYTPSGLPIDDPSTFIQGNDTNGNGTPLNEQEIKAGMIQWAPSSAKYEFVNSTRPTGNFQAYLDMLIRIMGLALNLPYGFLYNLASLNGPAARMDAQQAQRVIAWYQALMQRQLMERTKNTILLEGIGNGSIPYTPQWANGVWQYAPAISIDAGRDSASAIKEVAAGMLSKDTWFGESGQDADSEAQVIAQEAVDTIRRAKAIASTEGCTFEQAMNLLDVRTPNGWVAPAMQTDPAVAAAQEAAAQAAADGALAGTQPGQS